MSARDTQTTGSKRSLAPLGALVIAIAAFACVEATGWVMRQTDRTNFLARAFAHTEATLKAAVDPRFQTKADEIARVLTRLVVIDAVKGAALFDGSGHLQDSFGERTETGFESILRVPSNVFGTADPTRAEFYLAPAVTGTPFHLLVRTDVGEMAGLEGLAGRRITALAAAAAAAGATTLLFVWFGVAVPIRRIVAVAEKAIAHPGMADVGPPIRGARGELATLAAGVERLRSSLAEIWRTKVLVADAILESAPFAVVQLAPDGSPIFGNPAATALFGQDVAHGADPGLPLIVRDVETAERAVLREHFERHGGAPRLVEIAGASADHYAQAASLVVGAETRSPTTIAMFADVTVTHGARLEAEGERDRFAALARLMTRREAELKFSLETSLTLLSGDARGREAHLDIAPYAREWLDTAAAAGLVVARSAVNEDAPPVAGPREDLRAAVRLALLLAYARSARPPVQMLVEVKGINFETVGLTVRATGAEGVGEETLGVDWQLPLGALRAAVRRVGGQMSEVVVEEDDVIVRVVLRGAAERLTATRKKA